MKEGHTGLWPAYYPRRSRYPSLDAMPTELAESWETPAHELRMLFSHCGIGWSRDMRQHGRRMLLDSWIGKPKHNLPRLDALYTMKAHGHGQRKQQFVETDRTLCLPDTNSAYPSHHRLLPDGTTILLLGSEPDWIATWFQFCVVHIPHRLPLGPFPVATRSGLLWATEPGDYDTWLWAEQAFDAREAGCMVEPIRGYGWARMTDATAPWVDRMLFLRHSAPSIRCKKLIKDMTNSAIGDHAIGDTFTRDEDCPDIDAPLPKGAIRRQVKPMEGGYISGKAETTYHGRRTMIHWQRYTEMQVGRTMYREARPYALSGELVRIETDQIVVAA